MYRKGCLGDGNHATHELSLFHVHATPAAWVLATVHSVVLPVDWDPCEVRGGISLVASSWHLESLRFWSTSD